MTTSNFSKPDWSKIVNDLIIHVDTFRDAVERGAVSDDDYIEILGLLAIFCQSVDDLH